MTLDGYHGYNGYDDEVSVSTMIKPECRRIRVCVLIITFMIISKKLRV